ncbi:hypothetical protein FSB64_19165 [Paraburkholderia sp. JPY454]|uniref:Uncharacterized protein n=1 Tax=Paraburkholderia youngii TaxID=2782701 RepID=A0ABX2NNB2_9BURK|nr:hypothetical protein [Paraburkholderia youngii]
MVVNSPGRIKVRRRKIVKLWGAIAKVWRQTIELIVAALSYAAIMKLSQWYRARQSMQGPVAAVSLACVSANHRGIQTLNDSDDAERGRAVRNPESRT